MIEITRDNLENIDALPPIGYRFSAKKLTEKAKARLKGYWLHRVNMAEKEEDKAKDHGTKQYLFDSEWQRKYEAAATNCLMYLKNNKFICYLHKPKKY